MYIRNKIKPSIIIWFCWRQLIFFTLYSFVIYWAVHKLNLKVLAIPFLPVGTIGTAVAFYVGFKNNASYERLWEGRKIWASISNLCRAIGAQVAALPDCERNFKSHFISRQIAWCNLLRIQLRSYSTRHYDGKPSREVALIKKLFAEEYKETVHGVLEKALLKDQVQTFANAPNAAYRMLALQTEVIANINDGSVATDMLKEKIVDNLNECIKEQGAAERLKQFPFPRQYAYFSEVFVWIFLLLLPLGLLSELGKTFEWLVVPCNVLISWMFLTMEQVGDSSEDPFEFALNDVPMSTICRDIERELLQVIGEQNLPEPMRPVADILI